MKRTVWWFFLGMMLLANGSVVHAQIEDGMSNTLSDYQGDYVITESLKIDENLLPLDSEEELAAMSDEELLTLVNQVFESSLADPEVDFAWQDGEDLTNIFLLTVEDDYIIERNLILGSNFYMWVAIYEIQSEVSASPVTQFEHLESYLFYDLTTDYRSFFSMMDGNIYAVSLAEHQISKFEPIELVEMAEGLTPPRVELPTDECRSLAVYDVDVTTFEAVDFAAIQADSGQETLSLISLTGTILEYVSYWDYAEAKISLAANGTDDVVLLQFHYFPLDSLKNGDKIQVYGLYLGPNTAISWDETLPSMMVQKMELK